MTRSDLIALVEFNYWARDRMLASASSLTSEQYLKPMGNSFSSVRDTMVHIYSGEWVWCSRWHGASPSAHLKTDDYQDLVTLASAWRELEPRFKGFVDGLDDAGVVREIDYKLMNGQPYRSSVWQMVQHVVNHGTYHRGQVATLLRQLGASPATTDLIAFYRERTIAS